MYILGIETSCDETAACIVKNGRLMLSHVVASSLKEHTKYGGVIPEIASRRQLELISIVIQKAFADARIKSKNIDAIAVTQSPGLIGSLLVGLSFARSLSYHLRKPLILVDHVKAHLYANFLFSKSIKEFELQPRFQNKNFPAVGLVASGGHTSLYFLRDFYHSHLLGQTRDDAAGEAFDKVARLLKLGYPGGPIIDRLSRQGKNSRIRFPCAELPETYDFSFSGIKTAVLYFVNKQENIRQFSTREIAYAFQKSIIHVLVKKCLRACLKLKAATLLIGGGVAANSALRDELSAMSRRHHIQCFTPLQSLCLDNAGMIACLGYFQFRRSPSKNS